MPDEKPADPKVNREGALDNPIDGQSADDDGTVYLAIPVEDNRVAFDRDGNEIQIEPDEDEIVAASEPVKHESLAKDIEAAGDGEDPVEFKLNGAFTFTMSDDDDAEEVTIESEEELLELVRAGKNPREMRRAANEKFREAGEILDENAKLKEQLDEALEELRKLKGEKEVGDGMLLTPAMLEKAGKISRMRDKDDDLYNPQEADKLQAALDKESRERQERFTKKLSAKPEETLTGIAALKRDYDASENAWFEQNGSKIPQDRLEEFRELSKEEYNKRRNVLPKGKYVSEQLIPIILDDALTQLLGDVRIDPASQVDQNERAARRMYLSGKRSAETPKKAGGSSVTPTKEIGTMNMMDPRYSYEERQKIKEIIARFDGEDGEDAYARGRYKPSKEAKDALAKAGLIK